VSYRAATTISGTQVRLYGDVFERILRKHGELSGMETLISDTITSPDLVLLGHGKELLAVKHREPHQVPRTWWSFTVRTNTWLSQRF